MRASRLLSTLAASALIAGAALASVPRDEYPRPQFMRTDWVNLNGDWTCHLGAGDFAASKGLETKIVVPFCPQSRLSGLAHTDFIPEMWYHRRLTVPAAWKGSLVRLNFGAVDWSCEAFLDGRHRRVSHWLMAGGGLKFQVSFRMGCVQDFIRVAEPFNAADPGKGACGICRSENYCRHWDGTSVARFSYANEAVQDFFLRF